MGAAEQIGKDQLLRHLHDAVIEQDHVVRVPAHRAADVQQKLVHRQRHRGQLVGDVLGRVEMAHVEAQERAVPDRVAEVELVAAHGHRLDPDAEELRFDRVEHVRLVERRSDHLVERGFQPPARRHPVDGDILRAVRHPDVVDRRAAQRLADPGGDLAAAFAVLDPELADALVGVGEREVVVGLGMGKEGRVEIEPDPLRPGPVDPGREMAVFDLVAVRRLVGIHVEGVQVQPVLARDLGIGKFQIGAQLVGGAGAAGVIAGGLDAAAGTAGLALEADHVVALPAMHRDRDRPERGHRRFGVDAPIGKHLARDLIGFAHLVSPFPRSSKPPIVTAGIGHPGRARRSHVSGHRLAEAPHVFGPGSRQRRAPGNRGHHGIGPGACARLR